MDEIKVFDDLHLFNSYMGFIDLSFNQFLLYGKEPVLIHTGSKDQTAQLIPKLKNILGDRQLSYIFISHFESDECGGISLLINEFPNVKAICSQVTARQLTGFGLAAEIITKNPGDTFQAGDYTFKFINYPSEMHLWEGLLAFEESKGILFSSDLFIRRGKLQEAVVDSKWETEIQNIASFQVPSQEALKTLQETLSNLKVKYVMTGHGPFLKV